MKKSIITAMILLSVAILSGCRDTQLPPARAVLPEPRGPKPAPADAQMARGEYYDASVTYRKIYNNLKRDERSKRGEVAFKMAEAHRKLNQFARASAAYQNAIRYGYPEPSAQLYLAQMLHADGKYAQAVRAYEEYLMQVPGSPEATSGLEGSHSGSKKTPPDSWCATPVSSTLAAPISLRCTTVISFISPLPTKK